MKIALITGASSGIGRATAIEFARAGYHLALAARRKDLLEQLVEELHVRHPKGKFLAVGCDVGDLQSVRGLSEKVSAEFDHLNILINNAGAFEYGPLEKSSKIGELIACNVNGMIWVTRALLPLLEKSVGLGQWTKVINVGSISGLWGMPNLSTYCASKFAVTGFTNSLAREFTSKGIHVGGIYPGPVNNMVYSRRDVASGKHRKMTMYPNEIATQMLEFSLSPKRSYISHWFFSFLSMLELVSPRAVDYLFAKATR